MIILGLSFVAVAAFLPVSSANAAGYRCHGDMCYSTQYAHQTKKYRKRYHRSRSNSRKRYRRAARMPSQRAATGEKVFVFSPRRKSWGAYNASGRLIRSGRASGGRHYCPDVRRACRTPRGSFRIISKGGAGCKSSRYPKPRGGAPMPYCMFFSKHYGVHGSYDVPNRNASHGCIRVVPSAAKWLHRNFLHIGTKVVVTSY